jgi:hypothetical protein
MKWRKANWTRMNCSSALTGFPHTPTKIKFSADKNNNRFLTTMYVVLPSLRCATQLKQVATGPTGTKGTDYYLLSHFQLLPSSVTSHQVHDFTTKGSRNPQVKLRLPATLLGWVAQLLVFNSN